MIQLKAFRKGNQSPTKPKARVSKNKRKPKIKRQKTKVRIVQMKKFTEEEKKEIEFKQICDLLKIDPLTENEFLVKIIKLFLNSRLDPGWIREIDETGVAYYYFKPDNYSRQKHPHLNRLKAALIQHRELGDQQKEEEIRKKAENAVKLIKDINHARELTRLQRISGFPIKQKRDYTRQSGSRVSKLDFQQLTDNSKPGISGNELKPISNNVTKIPSTTSINKSIFDANQKQPKSPTNTTGKPIVSTIPTRPDVKIDPKRPDLINIPGAPTPKNLKPTPKNKGGIPNYKTLSHQLKIIQESQNSEMRSILEKGHYLYNKKQGNDMDMRLVANKPKGNNVQFWVLDTRHSENHAHLIEELGKIDIGEQEQFYKYAEKYYKKLYGFPLLKVPQEILDSKEYKSIPVERALQIFYQLGLKPRESHLFQLAMLIDALPIPPEIIEDKTSSESRYFFQGKIINKVFKPGIFYIQKNVELLKKEHEGRIMLPPEFKFLDKLGREYSVDLERLYKEWLENPQERHFIDYGSQRTKVDFLNAGEMLGDVKRGYERMVREIMDKNYGFEGEESAEGDKTGISAMLQGMEVSLPTAVPEFEFTTNVQDIHMIELMKQLKIDVRKDIHLLYPIEEFIKEHEATTPWQFRIKPDGSRVWVNKKDRQCAFEYPHINELKKKVEEFRKEYEIPVRKKNLKSDQVLDIVLCDPKIGKAHLKKCKRALNHVLCLYLNGGREGEKSVNPESLHQAVEAIRKQVNLILKAQFSMEDFINFIFFCDFDLERYVLQKNPTINKKDKVLLRSMNPDRVLLQTNKLIKPLSYKDKGKVNMRSYIAMKTFKSQYTISGLSRRAILHGQHGIQSRGLSSTLSKYKSRMSVIKDEVPELGPITKHLHLIDPELRRLKGEENLESIEQILEAVNELESLQASEHRSHLNSMLEGYDIEKEERRLDKIIKKIEKLYSKLELDKINLPKTKLMQLKKMRLEAVKKRNKIKLQKLKFDKGTQEFLNDVLSNSDKYPRLIVPGQKKDKILRTMKSMIDAYEGDSSKNLDSSRLTEGREMANELRPGLISKRNIKNRRFKARRSLLVVNVDKDSEAKASQKTVRNYLRKGISGSSYQDDDEDSFNISPTNMRRRKSPRGGPRRGKGPDRSFSRYNTLAPNSRSRIQRKYSNSRFGKSGKKRSNKDSSFNSTSQRGSNRNLQRGLSSSKFGDQDSSKFKSIRSINEKIRAINQGFNRTLTLPMNLSDDPMIDLEDMAAKDPEKLKEMIKNRSDLSSKQKKALLKNLVNLQKLKSLIKPKKRKRPKIKPGANDVVIDTRKSLFESIGKLGGMNDLGFGIVKKLFKVGLRDNNSPSPSILEQNTIQEKKEETTPSHNISRRDSKLSININRLNSLNINDPLYKKNKILKFSDVKRMATGEGGLQHSGLQISRLQMLGMFEEEDDDDFYGQSNLEFKGVGSSRYINSRQQLSSDLSSEEANQMFPLDEERSGRGLLTFINSVGRYHLSPDIDYEKEGSYPRDTKLKTKNLYENIQWNEALKQADTILRRSPKGQEGSNNPQIVKTKSGDADEPNLGGLANSVYQGARAFARVNQTMPFRMIEQEAVKTKIEIFILTWLYQNLGLSEKRVAVMLRRPEDRKTFFKINRPVFEFFIESIMKNPNLCQKATNFVFSKLENAYKSMKRKQKEEKEIRNRQLSIETQRKANNHFIGIYKKDKNSKPHNRVESRGGAGGTAPNPARKKKAYLGRFLDDSSMQSDYAPPERSVMSSTSQVLKMDLNSQNASTHYPNMSTKLLQQSSFNNSSINFNSKHKSNESRLAGPYGWNLPAQKPYNPYKRNSKLRKMGVSSTRNLSCQGVSLPLVQPPAQKLGLKPVATSMSKLSEFGEKMGPRGKSRGFLGGPRGPEFATTSSRFRKKKMFMEASRSSQVFFKRKKTTVKLTSRQKYQTKRGYNLLELGRAGISADGMGTGLTLRTTSDFFESRTRFGSTEAKSSRLTNQLTKRLAEIYGECHQVHRIIVKKLCNKKKANMLGQSSKLRLSSLKMVTEVAEFMTIIENQVCQEPDLMWIAALVVLHYQQYIKIFEETKKNWRAELSYFFEVLHYQRIKRHSLEEEVKQYDLRSGTRISFEKIVTAISWLDVLDSKGKDVFYNFVTEEVRKEIPRFDQNLLGQYYNYSKPPSY